MIPAIDLAAAVFAALATGGLLVNWFGLSRAMLALRSPAAYAEFHRAAGAAYDPYMPIVVVGAIVGCAAMAVLSPGPATPRFWLAAAATLGYVAGLVVSLVWNVPMNRAVAGWTVASPPAGWADLRARWVRFHVLRTLFSCPALVCCLLARG